MNVRRRCADSARAAARERVLIRVDEGRGWVRKVHIFPCKEGGTRRKPFACECPVALALRAPSQDEQSSEANDE